MRTWINGQPIASVSVADRGLAFGDGLFETMRVVHGCIPLLEQHMARLSQSCKRLALPLDVTQLLAELEAFIDAVPQGVCKLIYTRGVGQRGYAAPEPVAVQRILQLSALPNWPATHFSEGVTLFPCQTRLAHQPLLAGMKHLNRLEQVLARAEWHSTDFAEGLVLDQQQQVIEGVFSNVFCVLEGELCTPDLSQAGVLGTMRAWLLVRAQQLGYAPVVRSIGRAQLSSASEVFICNSLYGVWPVRACANDRWPLGPITQQLQQQVAELYCGT
ncbi:aminodeoxychorismate lyase [Thiopseudomonas alkaliphila]|uniref:aminodeoxychorismate lyase n=1 Tax=Thiopseudomonas alkaliphila TaxID=1697053 RepID=UPI0025777AE8|nr:aminodeoxychorismate lyase [Thiopseudomonas alkaliphila]MDM1707220.1 aminodeoxychorismate lyase [Thiopseudomonas alkaliphila]